MQTRLRLVVSTILLVCLSSCRSCGPELPTVRQSDAGDYSFVRQAVPKLAGRKARGYAEVKVLADLISQTNRPTVLRAMLLQEDFRREYIEHWSENTVDFMRAHRDPNTDKRQTGPGMCFGPSKRTPPDYSPGLARYVRDNAPTAPPAPGGDFNFSDLLRSSYALDNLSPAYRAYLFAMVSRPLGGNEVTEQNKRDDLGAAFTRVYTHRQITCLACHTTTNSTTGPQTFWNRHFPIRGQFATALFGSATGRPSDEVHAMLRTDVAGGSSRPWGIEDCGSFVARASVPNDSLTTPAGLPLAAYFAGPRGRKGSVWQLESILHSGYDKLLADGLRRSRPEGSSGARCAYCSGSGTCPNGPLTTVPPLDSNAIARESDALGVLERSCFICHASGMGGLQMDSSNWKANLVGVSSLQSDTQMLVSPGDADASYLMAKLDAENRQLPNGTERMPFGGALLPPLERDKIRNWIDGLHPSSGCATCAANACETDRLEGDAAFAFLTAGRVVENTWDEVMGAPLTLPNYFPRNAAQRDILWTLTETQFVSSGWSMQRLLRHMLTTDYFNRLPPAQSTGPSAYELPMFIDPWVAGDPRQPPIALPGTPPGSGLAPTPDPAYDPGAEANRPRHHNSVADGVHRYSPRALLQSVHKALGWPAPKRESSPGDYPDDNLRKSLGQFYRDAEPGFREVGFQGLLNWEQAHGRCQKPSNHSGDDWIDLLVAAIPAFNAGNPSDRARLRDVVLALKDRLLADASLQTTPPTGVSQDEAAAFAALFGMALTDEPDLSTRAAAGAFKQKVRDSCGILLETPQFMLAGTAPTQLGERPRLQVCLPGEPCGYREVCDGYVTPMSKVGYSVSCRDDSLTVRPLPSSPVGRLREFCPPSLCGVVPFEVREVDLCLTQPLGCFRQPPGCDPRCERIDCCGGPLPPIEGREMLLFWADKGRVTGAVGVQVLRSRKKALEPLAAGDELQTGEVLVLTAQSQLEIKTVEGDFRTPKEGLGTPGDRRYWFVQITGPQALERGQTFAREQRLLSVPNEVGLELSNKAYWLARGEAGLPTVPNQRKAPSNITGRSRRPPLTPMRPTWDRVITLDRRRERR